MLQWCVVFAVTSAAFAVSIPNPYIAAFSVESTEAGTINQLGERFDGCYSDQETNAFENEGVFRTELSSNTNAQCSSLCQEKGDAIAATRANLCYCANVLPLPRVHKADDPLAAGNGGPCSITCPGAYIGTRQACRGDECCGGSSAYSVFIVGNTDVLTQIVRRVMSNMQATDFRALLLTDEERAALKCRCADASISVAVTGQQVSSSGVGEVRTFKLTRNADGSEALNTNADVSNLEQSSLVLQKMEKVLDSPEPIEEEPFSNWDIACDNSGGISVSQCSKQYSESTGLEEWFVTEHGFDTKATIGSEFKAEVPLFASFTSRFEVTQGKSFTSGYTKKEIKTLSETFTISTTVPAGAKAEVRFFKYFTPVSVKWRATFFTEGYVIVNFGHVLEKKYHLSEVMTYKQREVFAFGRIDYGERPTLVARTRVVDQNGNTILPGQADESGKSGLQEIAM